MNIATAAKRAGLPAKTIRYYEEIGLITPSRAANGYRDFSESDLHKLIFTARARALGFSVSDCRTLLALYEDSSRNSADVKALATDHLRQIEAKISELQAMHKTLAHLVHCCQGNTRPDCPILDGLAEGG